MKLNPLSLFHRNRPPRALFVPLVSQTPVRQPSLRQPVSELDYHLPKDWQTRVQQDELELAVLGKKQNASEEMDRFTFFRRCFHVSYFTSLPGNRLIVTSEQDPTSEQDATTFLKGVHNYIQTNTDIRRLLFQGTLLEDLANPLVHTVLMSVLSYMVMDVTIVRSGVNLQSKDVALAYRLPCNKGGFFHREGQQLDVSDRDHPYIHIPNPEIVQRLQHLRLDRLEGQHQQIEQRVLALEPDRYQPRA